MLRKQPRRGESEIGNRAGYQSSLILYWLSLATLENSGNVKTEIEVEVEAEAEKANPNGE